MAINAGTVWEMRSTGGLTNGGGYDSTIAGAGTDYSLQDPAQLTLTDLACVTATATLTSVTGGFTAAMIGNAICISAGTNFTTGYYFIIGHTNTNTVTLDRSPVGGVNGSAGTGSVGGAISAMRSATANLAAALVSGNTVWVKKGTYGTFISTNTTINNGVVTAPIVISGYKTTRGDATLTTDRPELQYSNTLTGGNYNFFSNLYFNGVVNNGILVSAVTTDKFTNCKINNTGTATSTALLSPGTCIKCEFQAANGKAVSNPSGALFQDCYFHDSANGVLATSGAGGTYIGCIFDTNSTAGIDLSSGTSAPALINCVIYNCVTGYAIGTVAGGRIFNCIITGCTTGFSSTNASTGYVAIDYNIWNNTSDGANLVKGPNDLTTNPLLVDPANGDFTLQATSPALNVGMMPGTPIGVVGSYRWNIGADQDSNQLSWTAFVG